MGGGGGGGVSGTGAQTASATRIVLGETRWILDVYDTLATQTTRADVVNI